jgi:hypothetical protein
MLTPMKGLETALANRRKQQDRITAEGTSVADTTQK